MNIGSDLRYQQKLSEIHEAVDTSHQILQFIDIPSKLSYKFGKITLSINILKDMKNSSIDMT